MTLYVYCNKTIYADDKATTTPDENVGVIHRNKKLFTSQNKYFAYAKTGNALTLQQRVLFEEIFTKALLEAKDAVPELDKDVLSKIMIDALSDILLMTATRVYEITRGSISEIPLTSTTCMGSGHNMFEFAMVAQSYPTHLQAIKKIYSHIANISSLSGEMTDYVRMSKLKTLPKVKNGK